MMDHSQIKQLFKGDERLENWLYLEEQLEAIVRQQYETGIMGNETTTFANYVTVFGSNTHQIERRGYSEAIKTYVHEVDDVLNYFNMYKFHPDASEEAPEGDRLTEIGLGIWSMVIKRLDDAYAQIITDMEA